MYIKDFHATGSGAEMKIKRGKKRSKQKRKRSKGAPSSVRRSKPRGLYSYVYVLRSMSSSVNRTYVGVTNDPMKRIRQHNGALSGGASYTKRFRPWAFYAIFRFNSRHDALSVEWKTKHQRKKSDGPPGPSSIVRRIYRHGAAKSGFVELVSCQV